MTANSAILPAAPRADAIAIHGVGAMGGAILAGLVRAGRGDQVIAVEADPEKVAALAAQYPQVRLAAGPEAVSRAGQGAATHLIVVKPQMVAEAVDALAPHLKAGDVLASLALGITCASLAARVPEGVNVLRVMPNTPALVGAGMSAISPGPGVSAQALARVESLLALVGDVTQVEEAQQDAVTAVSGSGPAYIFAVVEAMVEAGIKQGLSPEVARQLAAQTAFGAGLLLHESGDDPAVLRQRVTSPGGSTAAALEAMAAGGLAEVIEVGMAACARRSAEVSRELSGP